MRVKTLEQTLEELVMGSGSKTEQHGIRLGWAECLKALSEQSGEFLETEAFLAADTAINDHAADRWDMYFLAGAKWQFEQDRARIGGAIAEGRRLARESMSSREIALTARLEQAERERDDFKMLYESEEAGFYKELEFTRTHNAQLEEKLAAAEAEREKYNADKIYWVDTVQGLEKRVRELEAAHEATKSDRRLLDDANCLLNERMSKLRDLGCEFKATFPAGLGFDGDALLLKFHDLTKERK